MLNNLLISDAHNRLRIYQQKIHGYRSSVIQNATSTDAKSFETLSSIVQTPIRIDDESS